MRVKRGSAGNLKHNRYKKAAKGFRGRRKTCITFVKTAVHRSWENQYIGRKLRKRDFRRLWIARINAAARLSGTTYSELMNGLKVAKIELNRKVLADLAVFDLETFQAIAEKAVGALPQRKSEAKAAA